MRPLLTTALALALVLCVLFRASLFGGKVLTQADALNQFAPWSAHAPAGFRPGNGLLLDQATGFLPWMDFQAAELRRGEVPLWNPYNYCGAPLVGACQSATFSPLQWLYFAWPSWQTHVWIALLKLWLGGWFMTLFLLRLRVPAGAAAVGALGFMLCGFQVVWLNHPHATCAAFLPGLLWAVERMAQRPARPVAAAFGLLVGLVLLAGHAQTALHVLLFVLLFVLFRLGCAAGTARLGGRALAWLVAGGFLGLFLGMPQMLPFVEYLRHSQAAQVFSSMDTVAHAGIPGAAALLMVAPGALGAPHTHDYHGPLGANLNYNELVGGHVGLVLLVLALAQGLWLLWRRPDRGAAMFFLAAAAAVVLVGWQVEPFYGWANRIPLLGSTKLLRVQLFLAVGLVVLGSMALGHLSRAKSRGRLLTAGAFALAAAELLWFAQGYNPEVDPATLLPRTKVAEYLAAHQGHGRALGTDNTIFKPNANLFHRVAMVSGYDSVEDRALAELVLRMTQRPPEFPFLSQIGAFDRPEAFPLACLLGVKHFLGAGPLPPPLRLVLDAELKVYENPLAMPRAFLARAVQVIADKEARLQHLASAGFDPHVAVLEAPPAVPVTCAPAAGASGDESASILLASPRQLDVAAATGRRALLVVADTWDPGWSATVAPAGEPARAAPVPIERVDHAFRGVWLDPGQWVVRFRYDPWSVRLGLFLGAIATLGLLLLCRGATRGS